MVCRLITTLVVVVILMMSLIALSEETGRERRRLQINPMEDGSLSNHHQSGCVKNPVDDLLHGFLAKVITTIKKYKFHYDSNENENFIEVSRIRKLISSSLKHTRHNYEESIISNSEYHRISKLLTAIDKKLRHYKEPSIPLPKLQSFLRDFMNYLHHYRHSCYKAFVKTLKEEDDRLPHDHQYRTRKHQVSRHHHHRADYLGQGGNSEIDESDNLDQRDENLSPDLDFTEMSNVVINAFDGDDLKHNLKFRGRPHY
jgi:hypothetical protein